MTQAILIVDMAGFSALMEDMGVHPALDALEHHFARSRLLVDVHGGTWVKTWADNFAAVFDSVEDAHRCARVLTADGSCCAGIGYGPVVLDRPVGDLWGVEVNRASKLGEDIAQPGQVRLTEAAMGALPAADFSAARDDGPPRPSPPSR